MVVITPIAAPVMVMACGIRNQNTRSGPHNTANESPANSICGHTANDCATGAAKHRTVLQPPVMIVTPRKRKGHNTEHQKFFHN